MYFFFPFFPISGRSLLYLTVSKLCPLVLLIRAVWNMGRIRRKNAELIEDKPVPLHFIPTDWQEIEAESSQLEANNYPSESVNIYCCGRTLLMRTAQYT
jgi:hypothetical protein